MKETGQHLLERLTWLQVVIAAGSGLITFIVSNLLQDPLAVGLGEQLILSVVVGGVTLLSEILTEFGKQVRQSSTVTHDRLESFGEELGKRMDDFSARLEQLEVNTARQSIEESALATDLLNRFVRRAGRMTTRSPDLVRSLAHHQVDRVSSLMRSLSLGEDVYYEGEDREWLLGLAQNAQRSIVATSLLTVDARPAPDMPPEGRRSFEGGLWLNDLGARYLDVQRAAVKRGVRIRRIFVFDGGYAEDIDDPSFIRVRRLQRSAGVEIRGLDESLVPDHLADHITDFIVFDDVLSYETSRASRVLTDVHPAIVTTRIVLHRDRVERSRINFEELWTASQPLPNDL